MSISQAINKGHDHVKTRAHCRMIFAQTLNNPGMLLGNDVYSLKYKNDRDDKNDGCDEKS
jgi:hypothetical protein